METVSASFASKRTKILQDKERQLMKSGKAPSDFFFLMRDFRVLYRYTIHSQSCKSLTRKHCFQD